jgi:integrase
MLYKWRHHRRNGDEWEPEATFKTESAGPRDYLRMEERKKIKQAALEYGSIPVYSDLDPDERDRWKRYLAQKLGKPKEQVKPSDWEKANGWKIPSLVYVSMDAGLRPVEVETMTTQWVDLENGELQIPKDESAKSRDNYNAVLTQKTQKFLKRWLQERKTRPRYDDRDKVWLTRESNPYGSSALAYILEVLAEEAGMDTKNRSFHWYMIRHSTGTYATHMISEEAAVAQIRSKLAPEKYDQVPPDLRREGLEEIG